MILNGWRNSSVGWLAPKPCVAVTLSQLLAAGAHWSCSPPVTSHGSLSSVCLGGWGELGALGTEPSWASVSLLRL